MPLRKNLPAVFGLEVKEASAKKCLRQWFSYIVVEREPCRKDLQMTYCDEGSGKEEHSDCGYDSHVDAVSATV